MSINVFLPCRKGSQRIPNKNTKEFAGIKGGLLEIKLGQLIKCKSIDTIVVSSNDDVVLDFVSKYSDNRIVIDERPEHLGSSETSTDDLIEYVPSIIQEGHILWTHVTSPFIDQEVYDNIISSYKKGLNEGFDSLMTVKEIRGFIWNKTGPISYDRNIEKWPRTQTIEPLYEVDSSVFMSGVKLYKQLNDRIGVNPFIYVQNGDQAIDIDWPEDFTYAESRWLRK
ncbi:acylneuraminate cytidylyltransferase [Vibrio sp. JCM 19236]|nr:acylneuraminate cytidylyltransferase [Vibrio sp. JCM 19236]